MDDIDRRGLIAENEQQLAKLKRDLERRKIEQIWEQPLERKDGGAGLIYKTRGADPEEDEDPWNLWFAESFNNHASQIIDQLREEVAYAIAVFNEEHDRKIAALKRQLEKVRKR